MFNLGHPACSANCEGTLQMSPVHLFAYRVDGYNDVYIIVTVIPLYRCLYNDDESCTHVNLISSRDNQRGDCALGAARMHIHIYMYAFKVLNPVHCILFNPDVFTASQKENKTPYLLFTSAPDADHFQNSFTGTLTQHELCNKAVSKDLTTASLHAQCRMLNIHSGDSEHACI